MTKIQILTAALNKLAFTKGQLCAGCRRAWPSCDKSDELRLPGSIRCPGFIARAALEAEAKVPGLAQDEALVDNASYAVYEATKATPDMSGACRRAHGDMENIRVARAVLRAIDAYQRGGK